MKKKLLILGLSILSLTSLIGCGSEKVVYVTQEEYNEIQKEEQIKKESKERFKKTGNRYLINNAYWDEVVDTKTNNIYICNMGTYRGFAGISPLYDENGNIAKYNSN